MKKKHPPNNSSFEQLLLWLNPDRDRAGEKYEEIRFKLINIYARRGCIGPDELADKTIDIVRGKLPKISKFYTGDKNLYFYGVVKYVYKAYLKDMKKRLVLEPLPPTVSVEQDEKFRCLEECLAELGEQNRDFILQYYQGEKTAKIDNHKQMAESLNVTMEALRMRVNRIKRFLKKCVGDCVGKKR